MKYLPATFHVFSITQRGHGNSDHPETGYSSKHFAADIAAFVWKKAWEGFMQFDFRKELTNVNKPALIIWGDKDPYCPLADQQLLVSALKDSRLVVYNDCGHSLHWEEPQRFANDVAKFIELNIKSSK